MRQKTKIDFSRYRTADLVQTIVEIINLPNAFRSIIRWAFCGIFALIIWVTIFLKLTGNLTIPWTFLFDAYAIPTGFIVGLALGICEFIRRSLGNMTKLVDLLLETTKQIAKDSRGLYSGDKSMPQARDLVDDVYHHVILVTLKTAVFEIFGFLGRPVYWFYHLSLNQFVRAAIRFIPKDETQLSPELVTSIEGISDNEGLIISRLRWSQEKIQAFSGWIKLLVMIPCYIVLAIVILLILLPIFLAWLLVLPGTPDPGAAELMISSLLAS